MYWIDKGTQSYNKNTGLSVYQVILTKALRDLKRFTIDFSQKCLFSFCIGWTRKLTPVSKRFAKDCRSLCSLRQVYVNSMKSVQFYRQVLLNNPSSKLDVKIIVKQNSKSTVWVVEQNALRDIEVGAGKICKLTCVYKSFFPWPHVRHIGVQTKPVGVEPFSWPSEWKSSIVKVKDWLFPHMLHPVAYESCKEIRGTGPYHRTSRDLCPSPSSSKL